MKRLLFMMALVIVSATTIAQRYEPNTKWPYIYEDFQPGTIYFEGNQKNSNRELNIHLMGNQLHYISGDGRIFQSDDQKVIRVEIGNDAYIYSDHKLVKIVATEGTDLLVMLLKANFDTLLQGNGAYGASLNSSATQDLSSLEIGGLDHPELGLMLQEKKEGRVIPIVEQYYFIIDGQQVEATKKGVEKFVGDAKADALKQFLKENKTKWKKEDSLKQLLGFLSK